VATCSWINGQAESVDFDSVTNTVTVNGQSRPATDEEIATGTMVLANDAAIAAQQSVVLPPVVDTRQELTDALNLLRTINADHAVTPTEAGQALGSVIPALEAFRDLEAWDPEAVKLTILTLAQAVQALYILASQGGQMSVAVGQAITALTARVTALETR